MKQFKYIILFLIASLTMMSCSDEKLDPNSIFDTDTPEMNEFDKWIRSNLTTPYNIQLKYKFDDKESNNNYNLAPAKLENSIALAKLIKHLWIDAYDELVGNTFLKRYSPRLFNFIGSPAYNTSGSIILGSAEGGLKVTLYNVNMIDINDIDIDQLNYWYFKTMHHEFAHILHQTKSYTTDFNLISAQDYQSTSWVNVSNTDALKMGFISPYASSETQEDFVELIAVYVTNTEAYWQSQLTTAGESGSAKILEKFAVVQDYLLTSWNIDIVELRNIVLRRSSEVESMDLTELN